MVELLSPPKFELLFCSVLFPDVFWYQRTLFNAYVNETLLMVPVVTCCSVQIPWLPLPSRPREGVLSHHAVLAHPGSQNGLHNNHGGKSPQLCPFSLLREQTHSINEGSWLYRHHNFNILPLQHVVFVVKFFVAWLIPDIPSDVKARIKRERYLIQGELHNYEVERLKLQLSASFITEPPSEMSLTTDKHEVLSECL